ncbi:hypothetical protein ES705_25446 [subsurface metagenome]
MSSSKPNSSNLNVCEPTSPENDTSKQAKSSFKNKFEGLFMSYPVPAIFQFFVF